jgi:hypothetical protein
MDLFNFCRWPAHSGHYRTNHALSSTVLFRTVAYVPNRRKFLKVLGKEDKQYQLNLLEENETLENGTSAQ